MSRSRISGIAGTLAVIACLLPRGSAAQPIAQRVAAVQDGKVRMTYASRPDLCGLGNSISTRSGFRDGDTRSWSGSTSEDVVYDDDCSAGPARLVVTMRSGRVDHIRAYIGGRWRPDSRATDIGQVSTRAVVDYLFGVATSASGKVAGDALFPTTLADSVSVIQPLYDIARDESKNSDLRGHALFWLSQQREDRAVDLLASVLKTARNQEVRKKAIFGLSQHHSGKGFPALRAYAEDNSAPVDLRADAIFWLGQRKGSERFDYLRGLYTRLDNEDLEDKVIFSMSQQKSAESMKWLVDLASNPGETVEHRKKALFWAGQTGGNTEMLASMYDRMRERELKDHLVFVLSQRRDRPAIDKLMSIARNDPDREMRRKAMFWLGQSKDPRVTAFLTDIITR
jgi:hypothetical protein